jgi:trehalose/maltose hydrolase-like predicted phosphorylase
MRTVDGLSFKPVLPPKWTGYGFKLRYRGRLISINVSKDSVRLNLVSGEPVALKLYEEMILLDGENARGLEKVQ